MLLLFIDSLFIDFSLRLSSPVAGRPFLRSASSAYAVRTFFFFYVFRSHSRHKTPFPFSAPSPSFRIGVFDGVRLFFAALDCSTSSKAFSFGYLSSVIRVCPSGHRIPGPRPHLFRVRPRSTPLSKVPIGFLLGSPPPLQSFETLSDLSNFPSRTWFPTGYGLTVFQFRSRISNPNLCRSSLFARRQTLYCSCVIARFLPRTFPLRFPCRSPPHHLTLVGYVIPLTFFFVSSVLVKNAFPLPLRSSQPPMGQR